MAEHYVPVKNTGQFKPLTETQSQERFWRKVVKGDGCWVWVGNKFVTGYGSIKRRGRYGYAHRFSWEMHNGPIPPGACVCHRCDNPPCVRPDHLFLGTRADNSADMVSKNRQRSSRLSRADVLQIRALCESAAITRAAIARRFGISATAVDHIKTRKYWKHV